MTVAGASQHTFTGLHHKRQARVDVVGGLLALLGGHRYAVGVSETSRLTWGFEGALRPLR